MGETKEEKLARKAEKKERKEKKDKKDKTKSKEHKSEHKSEHKEHKSKEHKPKEHKSKEHESKEHKSKEHKSKEHKSKEHNFKEHKSKKEVSEKDAGADKFRHSAFDASSSKDVNAFLEENSVSIEVPSALSKPDPVLFMKDVDVREELRENLMKFEKPTPIQSSTWPHLVLGRDVVGVAETGSGKTLAFGVPAIQKLSSEPDSTCLVISPTRELAMQIQESFEQILKPFKGSLRSICLYGGVPKYDQQQQLRQSPKTLRVIVGTPGRLRDLIADGCLNLSKCTYLVLDEADRMLEKGFEQDIKEILSCAPSQNRQTVMFTATWPPEVRQLASTFMNQQVVKVSIGEVDELHANKRITQHVDVVAPFDKEGKFLGLLRKYCKNKDKVLVFALYKKEASRIERLLHQKGYSVAAVHGDLNQTQRTSALQDFKAGRTNLMLATDVAARGLDIPAVKVVINLTFPLTVEDYVHRIGRTGRAGQSGIAHTLFTEQEKHLAGALMNVLRDAGQEVPEELMKFGSHTKKKEHSLYGAFFKNVDPSQKAKKVKFD